MIVAGIDIGAKTVKVVAMKDGAIVGKAQVPTELDRLQSAKNAMRALLDIGAWDYWKDRIQRIVATGSGRKAVKFAEGESTVIACDAKGIVFLNPAVKTVIDVGADEARAVKLDDKGTTIDFVLNEKCAAGSGAFVEAMARAMQVSVSEFSELSFKSTKTTPINAQCAVFAESEVVSLVHEETSREDICRAVHDAIAARIASMARKIGMQPEVAMIGGVAYNKGMVDSLQRELKMSFYIPECPEYITAIGAAVLAAESNSVNLP